MPLDLSKKLSIEELSTPVITFASSFTWTFLYSQTLEDIIEEIRRHQGQERIHFLYVIDEEKVLLGVVSIKEILHYPAQTKLEELVDTNIVKIRSHQPLEKALHLLALHEILILPIVDEKNKLLGVFDLTAQKEFSPYRSTRLEEKRLKQDLFQLIGFSLEQVKTQSIWQAFRYRMPWLFCNLFGGLVCAFVGQYFQFTLLEFVVLATLIPLVLSLSESVAIQSMTLSLKFLHFPRIHWKQVTKRLYIEAKTSLLLGACCALVLTPFYFFWSRETLPLVAISASLLLAIMGSAMFGTFFPILLHVFRLDPKVAAGPVSLMMADILTVSIYLSFSTYLLI